MKNFSQAKEGLLYQAEHLLFLQTFVLNLNLEVCEFKRTLFKDFSMRHIIIVLILLTTFGCSKNSMKPRGAKRTVEGIVYADCIGNVAKGQKIILNFNCVGCFGGGTESQESTMTDENGHFEFKYRESESDGSTTSCYHSLTIPNSSINIVNPSGTMNLYPNDTLMNAVIKLKFPHPYTSHDTFYCQFKPTPNGVVQEAEHIQYFVGPFHDTTLLLNHLRIGNINSIDKGKSYCGAFKWGIGKMRLDSYYTGQDGSFYLTHEPCAATDHFEYIVEPIH